jgi:hypothetical protein
LLDETDPFDGLNRRIDEFLIAGCKGKSQRVVDQVFGLESMVVNGNIVDSFGDFQFLLTGLCHPVFINCQHDHGCVVFFCQGKDLISLGAACFEMRRVDETSSRRGLQGDFKNIQFSRIDHERDIHAHFEFLDHLAHQLHFVGTLGDCTGDVQGVCAVIDLFPGDLQDRIIILLEQEPLELARALGIEPLAKQGWRRILSHRQGRHGGGQLRRGMIRPLGMRARVQFLDEETQVLGSRPAAATHY